MNLYVFASVIVRYRAAAAAVLAATLIVTLLLCFLLPLRYTSTFTILSPEGGANPLLQSLNHNLYNTGMKSWVLPRVIRTDEFLEDVLKKSYTVWREGKPVRVSLASLAGDGGRRELVKKAGKFIRVEVDDMTGSVTVSVESPYPELSLKSARYILQKLERYADGTRRRLRVGNAEFYESRLAEARSGLRLVEGELGEYLKKNRAWLDSDDPGSRLELQQLKRKQQIYAGVYYELSKQREMDDLKTVALVPPLEVLDYPGLPTLKSFPRRRVLLTAGMTTGLLLSLLLVFGWDVYRRFKPA